MRTSRPFLPLRVATLGLLLSLVLGGYAAARAGPDRSPHGAGITVLASAVGNDYEVEDLLAFVEAARIRDVIVDWAWITLHWERTDFEAVDALVRALEKRRVRVAAMYRPRFKPHEIDRIPVAYQVDADGEPWGGACEIRYADAEARTWGTAWAVEIVKRCPAFDEVVVYNPSQRGQSEALRAARAADPDYDSACVRTFLAETRAALRKVRKRVKLGLVLPPRASLYEPYAGVVDVVRPFVFVREGADFTRDWDGAEAVQTAAADAGPALAKITWGAGERVSDEELAAFVRTARERRQRYVFWTFWTTFCEGTYDLDGLCGALGLDAQRIRRCVRDLGGRSGLPADPARVRDAVRRAAADTSDESYRLMLEVAARYGADAVEPLCRLLDDTGAGPNARWRAAGALGRIGSPAALPSLLRASRDPEPYVRWLAAEALGRCGTGDTAARKRLEALAASDPAWRVDPETGEREHYVRDTARRSLRDLVREAPVDTSAWERTVAVVAVKDFLRVESSAAALEDLELPRYFPAVDAEQVVLARWARAHTDDGAAVGVALGKVTPDPQGNLLHTWILDRVPARTGVVLTITSLVLRRERPEPAGRYPIPEAEALPTAVRPFLRSTPCVVVDHPDIRAAAAALRRETDDAYEVAEAIAARMRASSYAQAGRPEPGLPTSVAVLRHGGSCCGSAVCAAALLRACGIPAQLTYVPAGYVHGIVRFHLPGYGWCRMDATSGVGRLPLVTKRGQRGLVRLYDMPIELERLANAYAWPYEHVTLEGRYVFRARGERVAGVRFAARDEAEARAAGRVSGRVADPFPHLEPGSWHELLAVETWPLEEGRWEKAVEASRHAARNADRGWFPLVTRLLGPHTDRAWRGRIEERLRPLGGLSGSR